MTCTTRKKVGYVVRFPDGSYIRSSGDVLWTVFHSKKDARKALHRESTSARWRSGARQTRARPQRRRGVPYPNPAAPC